MTNLSRISGRPLPIALFIAVMFPAAVQAAGPAAGDGAAAPSKWSPYVRGGYVPQFDSDLDDGSSFDVDRFFVQGGLSYSAGPGRRVSFAVGAGRDKYNFSGSLGNNDQPWDRIDQLRLSVPVSWRVDEHWSLFAIPTLRSYGESGADSGDSVTGGALVGTSYRFSDRLTIGPGIGVLSSLEDSASVFPLLIVDWKITDRLSLETGRGLAATQGPGLNFKYRLSDAWNLGLGGRYESLRFRLDDKGPAPDGVGEDRSIPLYLSATYNHDRDLQLSAVAGVDLDGELRLEDADGRRISKESYDPAPFLGITFSARF